MLNAKKVHHDWTMVHNKISSIFQFLILISSCCSLAALLADRQTMIKNNFNNGRSTNYIQALTKHAINTFSRLNYQRKKSHLQFKQPPFMSFDGEYKLEDMKGKRLFNLERTEQFFKEPDRSRSKLNQVTPESPLPAAAFLTSAGRRDVLQVTDPFLRSPLSPRILHYRRKPNWSLLPVSTEAKTQNFKYKQIPAHKIRGLTKLVSSAYSYEVLADRSILNASVNRPCLDGSSCAPETQDLQWGTAAASPNIVGKSSALNHTCSSIQLV